MDILTRVLVAAVASLVALAGVGAPALAHSELLKSTPADGDRLTKAPRQVELVFGEGVQEQGGAIVVTDPDGARVDKASTFTTDGNVAAVALSPATTAGEYTVSYRVVSADGHVVRGTYAYELAGTSPSPSEADSTRSVATPSPVAATGADEDSTGVVWVLGLGAIGLALLAAVIAVAVRGRRGGQG